MNGILYAVGGVANIDGTVYLNVVEAYDPATDTWTKKADIPTPRNGLAVAVVHDKLYAIGGYRYDWVPTVEEYDPATDTWTKKANMPTRRSHLAASVVNDKIYVFGGFDLDQELAAVEEYDPATDQWTKKRAMPTARGALATAVVNGLIYAVGGGIVIDASGHNNEAVTSVELYDPTTDQWTKGIDLLQPRGWLTTAVVHGKLYAIGGNQPPDYKPLTTVEEFSISR